jgi:hypothetical protein
VQEKHRPRVPWQPQSRQRREEGAKRALPATASRFEENRTTHRADFERGATDKVYLKRIAAVENKDVAASPGNTLA